MCLQFMANLRASSSLIHIPALPSLLQSRVRTQLVGYTAEWKVKLGQPAHTESESCLSGISTSKVYGGPRISPLASK
jgi:hypothetical protein